MRYINITFDFTLVTYITQVFFVTDVTAANTTCM